MTARTRHRQPRYVVTMGLKPWVHGWLRRQSAMLLGDGRYISKVVCGVFGEGSDGTGTAATYNASHSRLK